MAWISRDWKEYEVLDATEGFRLESWAGKLLVRPDPQVIWATERADPRWDRFDAKHHRSSTGGGRWELRNLPDGELSMFCQLVWDRTLWGVRYGSARFYRFLGMHSVDDNISLSAMLFFRSQRP